MRSRIDRAGRLVIPKALRNQLGLRPGEVELTADGAALRMEPVHEDTLAEADGRLVIPVRACSTCQPTRPEVVVEKAHGHQALLKGGVG